MDTKSENNIEEPTSLVNEKKLSDDVKARIRGLDEDIKQAEEAKAEALKQSKEALKNNQMQEAEKMMKAAQGANQAITNMRLEQFELEDNDAAVNQEGENSDDKQNTQDKTSDQWITGPRSPSLEKEPGEETESVTIRSDEGKITNTENEGSKEGKPSLNPGIQPGGLERGG